MKKMKATTTRRLSDWLYNVVDSRVSRSTNRGREKLAPLEKDNVE